ncbi:MAG TPA: hypothetical protein VMO76_04310 [Candidatus Udaeobacter sp.]|nr:hypothetical protein [Candidatus Udaeobacter sp.]
MRLLAKSALIGTTVSVSLSLALLSMMPPLIAVLIWVAIPGFLLARVASATLYGSSADIFAFGNAQLLVLVTIGNGIFYWCVSLFLLRSRKVD